MILIEKALESSPVPLTQDPEGGRISQASLCADFKVRISPGNRGSPGNGSCRLLHRQIRMEAVAWPTVFHIFEEGQRDMDIRSGYLPGEKIFGHKTIGFFAGNTE